MKEATSNTVKFIFDQYMYDCCENGDGDAMGVGEYDKNNSCLNLFNYRKYLCYIFTALGVIKKKIRPLDKQGQYESR